MIPRNFKNAIIDPVKVIAPIEAPRDISIKLAILMSPGVPKLKAIGFKKAEIATKTAARQPSCETQQLALALLSWVF